MTRRFRRIITGHNVAGEAVVISDSEATQILQKPARPGVTLTNFWITDRTPAEYDGLPETCDGAFVLQPPINGSVFRCVEFEPEDPEVMKTLDGRTAFADMGAADNIVANARHPFMHRTDSVDYAIVLSGEIFMMLDDTEVLVRAGDVVVQRGTNHAWSNRGTVTCVIAFILIDGVTHRDADVAAQRGIPVR